ncbi:MAG TPA: AI-2E family transporter [Candidatus Ruthenibacterium merdavium]|uniref:AI-2E family transporter n=1 Tax=Candidatus Ruthenibacterium merdavium TaxID=2838752 RepID=A0A9D2Q646_9FIRM|nr:AI-2E family transporter [Candidatus Ruthenibacterium merdavium]
MKQEITFKKLCLLVLGGIGFFWILQNYLLVLSIGGWVFGLLQPLFIGFCIAFVLNVPMRFLEGHLFTRTKKPILQALRRPLCILISIVFIVTVLSVIFLLVIPELLNAFGVLAKSIPLFLDAVLKGLQNWSAENADAIPSLQQWLANLKIDWAGIGRSLITFATTGAGNLLGSTVQVATSIAGSLTNLMFSFFLALYMLLGKEKLIRQIRAVLRAVFPLAAVRRIEAVLSLSARIFASFITGQCTEACILGTLCWLGMTLLRLPYAPMIGALIGFTALIPIVGAFMGTIVGAFMIAMVNPMSAVWFVVFLLTLQQFEGNLIYPRVVGSSVGLPGIWVLSAVTIGGAISGIVGMLFSVPVASILYALVRTGTKRRLKEKQISYDSI